MKLDFFKHAVDLVDLLVAGFSNGTELLLRVCN